LEKSEGSSEEEENQAHRESRPEIVCNKEREGDAEKASLTEEKEEKLSLSSSGLAGEWQNLGKD